MVVFVVYCEYKRIYIALQRYISHERFCLDVRVSLDGSKKDPRPIIISTLQANLQYVKKTMYLLSGSETD